jgi:hypothetical protein
MRTAACLQVMEEHQTWRHKPGATLILLLACVAAGSCASARLENADLTGSAGLACGFDDGAATLIHLQSNDVPATWWVFSVEGKSPDHLDGEYAISDSARDGAATLRVCDNALHCTNAVEGSVVVTGHHPRGFDGRLDYRLPGQAFERRTFSASIEKTHVTCP